MSSPVLRSRFATSDFDRAREVLAAAYGDHEPVLRGAPERFVYDATAVEVDGLRVAHDVSCSVRHPPSSRAQTNT
ncbi:hypothetical protein ACFPK1_03320 [Actinomycetospora rhizophila]|uniref:Uncharacterized protein n=1 Tax=Actinomycetospora rhizophila TaxID=1416876 RepID=A0ABV9ZA75_9PSEU